VPGGLGCGGWITNDTLRFVRFVRFVQFGTPARGATQRTSACSEPEQLNDVDHTSRASFRMLPGFW
jgi:hypothetical protein